MSKLKEITGYNRQKKQVMKYINLHQLSLPPLEQLYEIALVDHNGKPYVFRILKPEPASDTLDDLACETLSVDLSDIKEIFIKLTDDQRNIVMHVYYLYKKRNDQSNSDELCEENPKIILQGPAGTGKSTIISFIEKLITWEENKTSDSPQNLKVIKCAFTGKAASNIDGLTLNHTFSIPIYKTRSLSKKRLDNKKEVLKDCVFFICDEISMVGERTMSVVNSRLQQIFDNNKLYGDRFVLLVGDLYQIDPVRQKPVYPKSKYWTCCEFYELTKIIRQQDEKFIKALNNFRDSKMTQKDIQLLKSREIQEYDQVPDSVIHLFYQNKLVDEYNNFKLNKSKEKEEVINAIEDCDDWEPSRLRVKIGIRYMITYNIDVGDGLANGTTGIVKDFDYDQHGCVSAVWMEFHSDVIGRKTRTEYLNKHNKLNLKNWVPIPRSKIVVKLKTDPKVNKTVGNMFPLKAAEAITVHKSQGQTYHDGVCVHFTADSYDKLRTDKSLQYVALTRVTRLEDLYIMGTLDFYVLKSEKFIRTEQELNRLRNEKKLKLAFETFEDKSGDIIIYLNTGGTFYEHYQFITADKWYGNASLLIFTETNTILSDQIDIKKFEIAFRSDDETALRLGGGIICYKQKGISMKVVSSILDEENKMYLTLLLFKKYLFILTGIKGDLSDHDFTREIKKFIFKYIRKEKCIFLIGDFNCDMSPHLANVFEGLNIKKKLSCDILTTSGENQCDAVFTRNFDIQQDQIGYYQYIPSSHKPIFVMLPPKSTLFKKSVSVNGKSSMVDRESQSFDDSQQQYVNKSSRSFDIESELIDSEPESINEESQSDNSETRSEDNKSESDYDERKYVKNTPRSFDLDSESIDSEPQSMNSDSQSINGKARSVDSEFQFDDGEPQHVNNSSRSFDFESQSMGSEPESINNESQSDNGKARSKDSESQSDYDEPQYIKNRTSSFDLESHSMDSESQSLNNDVQSMDGKLRSVDSELQSEDSKSQNYVKCKSHSFDSESQSDDDEPTYVRNTFRYFDLESRSTESEPQSINSDSQSINGKARSVDSESQFDDGEPKYNTSKYMDSESRSLDSEPQSMNNESQSMDSEFANSQSLSEYDYMEMD